MTEGKETQLADTPEIIPLSVVRKRRSPSLLLFPEQPNPSLRTEREFWSAGEKDIPSFVCSPWDFYEPFLELRSGTTLVLYNDRSAVRVVQRFRLLSPGESALESANLTYFPLLQVRHQNFVDICGSYQFEGQVFAITEYVGFSLEDLVQSSLHPSEPEIAYIICQVS
jgi:hypothetical protein